MSSPIKRQLGHELRQLRHAKGLRLVDVEAVAHVSHSHLSQLERGIREPSWEILEALFGAFDMTIVVSLHPRNVPLDWSDCVICEGP